MDKLPVSIGLYRHFKGQYFYVTSISKSCTNKEEGSYIVNYFNVCHPEEGIFSRKLEEFISISDKKKDGVEVFIKDRKDNVTGQIARMERVKELNFQLGSVSTEQLIDELRRRKDSPIHELDIEGLRSDIYSSDYVIGIKHDKVPGVCEAGVETDNVFFTEFEAWQYYYDWCSTVKREKGVFKRVFIELRDK